MAIHNQHRLDGKASTTPRSRYAPVLPALGFRQVSSQTMRAKSALNRNVQAPTLIESHNNLCQDGGRGAKPSNMIRPLSDSLTMHIYSDTNQDKADSTSP